MAARVLVWERKVLEFGELVGRVYNRSDLERRPRASPFFFFFHLIVHSNLTLFLTQENPIPKRPTLFTTLIPRSSILNRLPSPPKILPFLLLSLKFLEFYHSPTSPFQLLSSTGSSLDGSSKSTTQPILPPPPQPTPSEKGLALLKDKAWGECPLCGLPWRAPTVGGRTGGWVYCWECLSDEVGEKGSVDPVTGTGWVTQESFRRVLI